MSISAKINNDLIRAVKWRLAINYPLFRITHIKKRNTSRHNGGESRKNAQIAQGASLKRGKNGQSAAKPRTEERATTIPCRSRAKRFQSGLPRVKTGEDIIYAYAKA